MTSSYVEQKTQQHHGANPPPQRKKVATNPIEEMAEGVLNGMFCHYEPPDPNRYQNQPPQPQPLQQRGILRRSSRNNTTTNHHPSGKKNRQSSGNRVRWEDEHPEPPPPSQQQKQEVMTNNNEEEEPSTGCSITQTCLDASIEVGCGGAGTRKKTKMMDAEEAIAAARAKSPRANGQQPDLIMDEHGNIQYADGKQHAVPPPPPPPPPPPSKNERYFPQLCGMRINCGGGEQNELQTLASTSQSFDYEKHLLQQQHQCTPGNTGSYDDQDNSILESSSLNSNSSLLKQQKSLTATSRPPENIHAPSNMMTRNKVTNTGGSRVVSTNKNEPCGPNKSSDEDDEDDGDRRSISSGSSSDDERSPKPSKVSSATSSFFRRVFSSTGSSNKKKNRKSLNEEQPIVISNSGDSDSIALSSRGRSRYRSRSASPPRRRSKTPERSSSMERKKGSGNNQEDSKKFHAKTINTTSRSSSRSNDDWDTSIPIVPSSPAIAATTATPPLRGRERGPSPAVAVGSGTTRRRNRSRSEERPRNDIINNKNSMIRSNPSSRSRSPARRRTMDGIPSARDPNRPPNSVPFPIQRAPPPRNPQQQYLTRNQPNMSSMPVGPTQQPIMQQGGGTTPVAPMMNRSDDAAERESFIMAYRQGFDGSIANGDGMMDDAMERQSFITAYRQGTDNSIINGGENNFIMDDMMERQSFITAHRQGFGGATAEINNNTIPAVGRAGGGGVPGDRKDYGTAYRQGLDPSPVHPLPHRQIGRPMTHEEMMRRHQIITAQRQGMKNPLQPSISDGGKANIPYPPQRSHSFEQDRRNLMSQNGPFLPPVGTEPLGRSTNESAPSYPVPQRMDQGTDRMLQVGTGSHPTSYISERGRAMPQPGMGFDPRSGTFVPSQPTVPYGGGLYSAGPMQHPQQPYGQIGFNNNTNDLSAMVDHTMSSMYYGDPYHVSMPSRTQPLQVIQPVVAGPTKLQEAKPVEEKKEEDLTWEERTRRAWERIRGGVESAFSLDYASKDDKNDTGDKNLEKNTQQTTQQNNQQLNEEFNSNSFGIVGLANSDQHQHQQLQQFQQQQQQLLFQQQELQQQQQQMFMGGRKVTFGPPEERIFYDDQDENRAMMMGYHQPDNRIVKKKMKFRGTKLLQGMFAKKKKSPDHVYPSMSTDSSIYPSYSNEWGSQPGATDDSSLYYGSASMSYDYDGQPQGMPYQAASHAGPQTGQNYFNGSRGQFQSPQRLPMGNRQQN